MVGAGVLYKWRPFREITVWEEGGEERTCGDTHLRKKEPKKKDDKDWAEEFGDKWHRTIL